MLGKTEVKKHPENLDTDGNDIIKMDLKYGVRV